MHTKQQSSTGSDRTEYENTEYYLPSMPSEALVEFLRRKVSSLNQYN